MAGLDRILETITEQGDEEISKILFEADGKAQRLSEQLLTQAQKEYDETVSAAVKKAERNIESAHSSARSISSRQVLALKTGLIEEVTDKAVNKILSMDKEEYFSLMYGLLASHMHPGRGVIVFNERDAGRLPDDFLKKAGSLKEGCSLEVADRRADISGGFILIYGEIEENCSLEALREEKRDEIRDEAARLLFGKGEE